MRDRTAEISQNGFGKKNAILREVEAIKLRKDSLLETKKIKKIN